MRKYIFNKYFIYNIINNFWIPIFSIFLFFFKKQYLSYIILLPIIIIWNIISWNISKKLKISEYENTLSKTRIVLTKIITYVIDFLMGIGIGCLYILLFK